MTLRSFGIDAQIEELDAVISSFEQNRRLHTSRSQSLRLRCGEHSISVLKSIAADLRGRRAGAPEMARTVLEQRIADVLASKTGKGGTGYDHNKMIMLAQEIVGRWPSIKQALTLFGAGLKNPQQNITQNITGETS